MSKSASLNPADIVFLGLKGKVTAISKSDGKILWVTELSGAQYVTMTADATRLYACTYGKLFCLDISTGEILWKNGLSGYGYGVASLHLYGFPPALDSTTYEAIRAAEAAARRNTVSD